ncbi:MAG: hypothetical protein KC478_06300 [Bacteriovoracaceae bacterium]|nr:hypothetical protein [Bacteriovoracaceae bacterium]
MKTTDNALLLKANQKQTTLAKTLKPLSLKSARPMKSMVRLKSARPNRVEVTSRIKVRAIKA